MSKMTVYQRAAQVWSILALAATSRQVLTYHIVSKLTGVPNMGLGPILEPIQSYCVANHLPPLTILVVSEVTGLPSEGCGEISPLKQIEVFSFDWIARGAPSLDALEQASRQLLPTTDLS